MLMETVKAKTKSHRPPPKVGAWFYEPLKAVENLEPPKGGYSSSLN